MNRTTSGWIVRTACLITLATTLMGCKGSFESRCSALFPNDEKLTMFCVDRMIRGESAEQIYKHLSLLDEKHNSTKEGM